jgi:hypothetical protein
MKKNYCKKCMYYNTDTKECEYWGNKIKTIIECHITEVDGSDFDPERTPRWPKCTPQ